MEDDIEKWILKRKEKGEVESIDELRLCLWGMLRGN